MTVGNPPRRQTQVIRRGQTTIASKNWITSWAEGSNFSLASRGPNDYPHTPPKKVDSLQPRPSADSKISRDILARMAPKGNEIARSKASLPDDSEEARFSKTLYGES